MKRSEIRNLIITGSYMIGDGIVEPISWKDYANKLEDLIIKNNINLTVKEIIHGEDK